MKFLGLALVVTTAIVSPAKAGEIRAISRIEEVTVFPRGADVTRVAEVTLVAGDSDVIVENLPGTVDAQSIRVAGEGDAGLEITSVDSMAVPVDAQELDHKRKDIDAQIAALNDERVALDQTLADVETQRQFLVGLANKQITPVSADQTLKGVDPGALGGLLDVMGVRLAGLAKTTLDSHVRQKAIDVQIDALNLKLAGLAPQGEFRTTVTLHLAAARAGQGVFKVSYRIADAGWQPFYDAKLDVPKDGAATAIEIVRRAEVVQSTTESWDNVALTLSTARPNGASTAPDVAEEELQVQQSYQLQRKAIATSKVSDDLSRDEDEGVAEVAAAPVSAEKVLQAAAQRQALIEQAGFQAKYAIQGRVSVNNSGMSKRVRIAGETSNAKLSVMTSPRLDANAYLTATFVVTGEGPMLPGIAYLYRDGMYVGQGVLPMLAQGEETKLGFGVDDLVKVSRREVKRRTGEEGLISSSRVEERKWETTIKNLHGFAVPVALYDRMPFATIDGVTVEMLSGTAPSEIDVEKKRGVMAWQFALEPAAEQVISFGYKVTAPQAVLVGMAD